MELEPQNDIMALREAMNERKQEEAVAELPDARTDTIRGLKLHEILKCAYNGQEGCAALYKHQNRGRFCYDHTQGSFYVFRGPYWELDLNEESLVSGIAAVIDVYSEGQKALRGKVETKCEEADGHIKMLGTKISKLRSLHYKRQIREMATHGDDGLGISGKQWDADPYLFCCKNCVIHLKTGTPRKGRPQDYLLCHSDIDYDVNAATPEKFLAFLESSFAFVEPEPQLEDFLASCAGDEDRQHAHQGYQKRLEKWQQDKHSYTPDMVEYIQTLLGSALPGDVRDHIFPVFYGQGRNGKGVLLETVKRVLGTYAGPVQPEILLSKGRSGSSSAASPDITDLKGKRLLWASETNEGRPMDTAAVKRYTGGDTLVGRNLYAKHPLRFEPTHMLILMTNNKPLVPAEDFAIWERIHLIPFHVSFVQSPDPNNPAEQQIDQDLKEKLKDEDLQILCWLIEGYLKYRQGGLHLPAAIKEATQNYRQEVDVLGIFIAEACETGDELDCKASVLYESYRSWCENTGHKALTQTKFGQRMGRKFDRKGTRNGRVYSGITSDYVSRIAS